MRFAIAPRFRGQGLGRSLIQDILKLAGSLGAKRVSLGVYGSNRVARRLYESMGFTIFGERIAPEDPSGVSFQMARAV
jgi:ribosomal protein S18 acetylase RimI-like enzyme